MDLITFGETMVLFMSEQVGPLRFAHSFSKTIGGADSNVAIGVARLGHKVGWFGRLGNDEFGKYVRNFIRGEGVDTSRVILDVNNPTAVFFKERKADGNPNIYYYRSNSAGSCLSPDDVDEDYIISAKYIHVTGITPALSVATRETTYRLIDLARSNGLTIIFDPNIRRKLWPENESRKVLMDIAAKSHIVLPGLEEGQFLTGASEPSSIAKALLENGCDTVVVKLGANGAYYDTGVTRGFVPGINVPVVIDPLGAGDAFAAGFISGQIKGWDLYTSISFANQMGAQALMVQGDIEGLPELDERGSRYAR